MKHVNEVTKLLVLVGGLNWGLVGAFNFNLVEKLLGFSPLLVDVVYVLVGLSAVWMFYNCVTSKK